ncbi:putative DNA binding protein [Trypoxylus dichotomus]
MSSEGENTKNISAEGDEKKSTEEKEKPEKMEVDNEVKEKEQPENVDGKSKENAQENETKENSNTDAKDKEKEEEEGDVKVEKKSSRAQKEVENDTKSEDTSEKEDNDKEEDDKKSVPLLDQPLEISGTRERKKVQRFNDNLPRDSKEPTKLEIPTGRGVALGDIPRIDASISRFKNDDLKLLHRLLFKTPGKTTMIKKNIKRFNGFDFTKDSEEYGKKLSGVQKFEVKQLKSVCEMLDLEKKGNKEEIAERIVEFLIEPKDSGKPVGGGRPKRTAAVKANNRGYSSHDESYSSDEKPTPRGKRDKGKRSNLKDESSSESDEEFRPSDASEDKPRANKRKRRSRKAQSDEEDISDVEESGGSSDDSEDEPKSKKRKVANSKAKPKGTPGRRGRKPAAAATTAATPASAKKKTPAKRGRKPARNNSSEESEHQEEEGSTSEDEPLVKKPKNPPTDEEIKSYVKDILEGANLEEITMKTVCKQVYAHYPDFDLTHKKDYIKFTVKSLIST